MLCVYRYGLIRLLTHNHRACRPISTIFVFAANMRRRWWRLFTSSMTFYVRFELTRMAEIRYRAFDMYAMPTYHLFTLSELGYYDNDCYTRRFLLALSLSSLYSYTVTCTHIHTRSPPHPHQPPALPPASNPINLEKRVQLSLLSHFWFVHSRAAYFYFFLPFISSHVFAPRHSHNPCIRCCCCYCCWCYCKKLCSSVCDVIWPPVYGKRVYNTHFCLFLSHSRHIFIFHFNMITFLIAFSSYICINHLLVLPASPPMPTSSHPCTCPKLYDTRCRLPALLRIFGGGFSFLWRTLYMHVVQHSDHTNHILSTHNIHSHASTR